jgi:NitT/TauT family transport system substrate-binding protein
MESARRRNLRLVTLMFIMPVVLAACNGSDSITPALPQPTTTSALSQSLTPVLSNMTVVRLGYAPVVFFAPYFVALERGYFAQEGIEAHLTPVQNSSDSVVQLAAGNFDVAAGGASASFFNAVSRGVKFKIVAPMNSEHPPLSSSLVISAKRTTELKSVADLKGRKVSINSPGAATEYWLSEALKKGNLTLDDIQLTSVSFADVEASLDSGAIDAAILSEPFATQNKDSGTISILSDDFIDGFTATYLYMGESLLQEKPEIARGFIKAYLRACGDLQGDYLKNDPGIAAIIEKYTHVPADVVARVDAPSYTKDGVVPIADLNTLQNFFLQRGQLDYKQSIDVTTFVDDSIGRQVASELK